MKYFCGERPQKPINLIYRSNETFFESIHALRNFAASLLGITNVQKVIKCIFFALKMCKLLPQCTCLAAAIFVYIKDKAEVFIATR